MVIRINQIIVPKFTRSFFFLIIKKFDFEEHVLNLEDPNQKK